MPKPTRDETIVQAFWDDEGKSNYNDALKRVAKRFGITPAKLDKLIIADDALNNGNH